MTHHTTRTVPALIGLSIVLSVAFFFRFYNLSEHLVFSTDQGRALLAGRNILLGDWITQGPPTSVEGLRLGPLYYYLTAVALWFSRFDPIGPTLMVAGMSLFTNALVYLYIWRYWSEKRLALWGGLAFALSPLVIWQARIAIEPSPLPLIVIIWLFFITEAMQQQNKKAWALATLLPFIGLQFNFSAIILWGAQALMLLILTPKIATTTKNWILALSAAGTTGLLLGKHLWSTPTSLHYWLQEWQLWSFPENPVAAATFLFIAAGGILFWLVSWVYRWYFNYPQHPLRIVLLSWLLVSAIAFSLKTVGGDHALAVIFVAPALLLAIGLSPLLKPRHFTLTLGGSVLFFLLWALQTQSLVPDKNALTLQDHAPVIQAITDITTGQPYSLVYRGHLDVYDAADDHYQYLLWYQGASPVQSGRIDLRPEHREQWLFTHPSASLQTNRTLYLYYPADALQRYSPQGTLFVDATHNFAIDIVE